MKQINAPQMREWLAQHVLQSDVIRFVMLSLVMVTVIDVWSLMEFWVEPLWFSLSVNFYPYLTWVQVFIIVTALGLSAVISRFIGLQRLKNFAEFVFGKGWDGWAMFWMTVIAIAAIPINPFSRIYSVGAQMRGLAVPTINQSIIFHGHYVALLIGLTIFQLAVRRFRRFSWWGAGVAVVVGGISYTVINNLFPEQITWDWFLSNSSGFNYLFTSSLQTLVLLTLAILFVLSRRVGFDPLLRLIFLGIIGTLVISHILLEPVNDWISQTYLPEQPTELSQESRETFSEPSIDRENVQNRVVVALRNTVILTLVLGGLSAVVARSSSTGRRLLTGVLFGTAVGLGVGVLVGSWASGIAAQQPLYGFVYDRAGYNDAEWVMKLGISVNNTMYTTLFTMWGFGLAGGLLAGLGALVVPVRKKPAAVSDGLPTWVISTTMMIPLLHQAVVVVIIVLALLGPTINDVLVPFGIQPRWSPMWIGMMMSLPALVILAGLILTLRGWLYRNLLEGEAVSTNHIFLNTLFLSGLLTVISGVINVASPRLWWSVAFGIFTTGWGLEAIILSRRIIRDQRTLSNRRRWVSAGIVAVSAPIVITWTLIAAALSMVLITVAMIVELSKTTAPPPGLENPTYLGDIRLSFLSVQIGSLAMALPVLILSGVVLSVMLVFNVPTRIWQFLNSVFGWIYRWLPIRLRKATVLKIATIVIAVAFDLFVWHLPVLTALNAVLFLNRKHVSRLPQWLLGMAFIIPGLFLSWLIVDTSVSGMLFPITSLLAAVSTVIVFHLIVLYTPLHLQGWRYLTLTGGLSIVLALVMFLQQPVVNGEGGVSSYDGSTWTAYEQGVDNSKLGTGMHTDILLRENGDLWFVNGGGTLSIYDGANWSLASVANLEINFESDNQFNFYTRRIPYLTVGHADTVWYASGSVIGRVAVNPDGIGSYNLESMCDTGIIAFSESSDSNFCNLLNWDGAIHSLAMTVDGDLWFTVDGTAYQVVAGNVTPLPVEIESPQETGSVSIITKTPTEEPRSGSLMGMTPTPGLNPTPTRTPFTVNAAAYMDRVNTLVAVEDTVWLAANTGLYQYDGDQPQLAANIDQPVTFVASDIQGNIWFATADGLYLLDGTATKLIISVDDLRVRNQVSKITALSVDRNGVLWIGTNNGLLQVAPETEITTFTSDNSGLQVNHVVDVVVDQNNVVWVSTFEVTERHFPEWLLPIIILSFWIFIGGGIWRDYRSTPQFKGKQIGSEIAASPDELYARIYDYLAVEPHVDSVRAAAAQLTRAGLHTGGTALMLLSNPIVEEQPQLERIATAFAADTSYRWSSELSAYYRVIEAMLNAQSINDIVNIELRVTPGHATGSFGIVTSAHRVETLPPFMTNNLFSIWMALNSVSVTMSKVVQVDDTGDRISYLASVLLDLEKAQSRIAEVSAPDNQVIARVLNHCRTIVTNAINFISGSANLRADLRTRQVKRDVSTTLVLKLDNIGQAAAENIRVTMLSPTPDDVESGQTATARLERLSPNRSETIELTLTVPDTNTVRVVFEIVWDDRLKTDNSVEYANIVQFHETETEFTPIANPYIVGHPVKEQHMFFGRRDVFEFIENNISGSVQDRTIVLYGQRRTGKTSLLYQLLNGRLGDKFIGVLIDMQAVALLIEGTADFLGEVLYRLEQSLEQTDIQIDVPEIDDDTRTPLRVFDRFLTELGQRLNDRRILFIFDEFELIEQKITEGKIDADILSYLRSLIQHRDSYVFLFAGTHRLNEMSHDYWSILFNIALTQEITFMNEQDTINLIRQPVAGSLSVDDLVTEKIIRLTSGHPYFTQLVCWAMVNHCNDSQHNYATINDVNDAVEVILVTGESHFAYIWQQATAQEQLLLAILAHHSDSIPWVTPEGMAKTLTSHGMTTLPNSEIIRILDQLTQSKILEATVSSPLKYRYMLDLLKLWVKRNKSIESIIERL